MEPEMTQEATDVAVDPEAPFGRRVDGTPKKAPGGRPPKATSGPTLTGRRPTGKRGRRPGLPGFMGGERPAAPPPPKTKPKPEVNDRDYTEGITNLLSLVALPLRKVAPLDCAAILYGAPRLAAAGNELAHEIPQVAEWCDKILMGGPWTGLAMAVAAVVGQVAENHGWLPPLVSRALGAVPRAVFAEYVAGMQANAAQAEQAVNEDAQRLRQEYERHQAKMAAEYEAEKAAERAAGEATGQWEPDPQVDTEPLVA